MPLDDRQRKAPEALATRDLIGVIAEIDRTYSRGLDARAMRQMTEILEARPDLTQDGADLIAEIRVCRLRPNSVASN
ncbi:hypothetical protein QFZ27_001679 [Inquilinus ginsengisoli]|jgi:hypothetical protein|uniref:hypothetical protein n=1 Tax=Inquilinus ginsengisoli TaxID=363840 RepID=UPI003D23747D